MPVIFWAGEFDGPAQETDTLLCTLHLLLPPNPRQDDAETDRKRQRALPIQRARPVDEETVQKRHNEVHHQDNEKHDCKIDNILLEFHVMVSFCFVVEMRVPLPGNTSRGHA